MVEQIVNNKTKSKLTKYTEKTLNLIKQKKRYTHLCNKDKKIFNYSTKNASKQVLNLKKLKFYSRKKNSQDKNFKKKKSKLKKNYQNLLRKVSKNNQSTIN